MRICDVPDHTAHIQRTGYPLGADDNIADQCEKCDEFVYDGENMFLCDNQWVCRDCFKELLKIRMIKDLVSFAEMLGISTKTAGE